MKKLFKKVVRERIRRMIAVYLAASLLFEIIAPTYVLALTGGPSQPEVQSFTPIGTSDMVDLFSGDFTYNIPLLDIDGYPINISYSGGISMDQEASWVGLGWNISPGVINRAMRGLPDDFNGDEVVKEFNMKPNKTFGVNAGFGFELFGDTTKGTVIAAAIQNDFINLQLRGSIGVNYNNYNGIGMEYSLNSSISAGSSSKSPLTGSLGLNSSSANGLSVQPSIGLSFKGADGSKNEHKTLTSKIGANFNSRMGLTNLTFTSKYSNEVDKSAKKSKKLLAASSAILGSHSSSFDFGMPTYTPDVDLPMNTLNLTASFKFGGTFLGLDGTFDISGNFAVQHLRENIRTNPAYGYMNSDIGQNNENALLDFNRENEGSFTPTTPALAISNFTYDLFSVSGQGVGGSYRPFRSDIGHVFDPSSETSSNSGSLGIEFATGNLVKGGVDVSVTHVSSSSGDWKDDNEAGTKLSYKGEQYNSKKEKYYFKEANEKSVQTDNSFFSQMGGTDAVRFHLEEESKFNVYADDRLVNKDGGQLPISSNEKTGREKRNQVISVLSRYELVNGLGIDAAHPNSYNAPGHHIAEMTSLGADGRRYVYGIAAYNTVQYETSFAVGAEINKNNGLIGDCSTGLVEYGSNDGDLDNSLDNKRGLDHFYSSTKMPAYAHSYLLSSVLSPDYVDADNIKGPSKGDLGTWIKFDYEKINNYKWRTPVGDHKANYNEGLKTDPNDDKASIVYGEKELWYVKTIETKNYIAIFELGDRKDGYGVVDKDGALDFSGPTMQYLKKITLYSKPDYLANGSAATPIKTVHFEYDYSLCPNAPNNSGVAEVINGTDINAAKGKLTLKRIYFTYHNSNKAKFSPYSFDYDAQNAAHNPAYNIKSYDRWGNYKPNTGNNCAILSGGNPSTAEYPYVEQNQATADEYSSAWLLREIFLPSGGKIKVDYESDDYAYVQNKRASQMFKIVGVSGNSSNALQQSLSFGNGANLNQSIYFELQPGYTNMSDYFGDQTMIYFRCLMETDPLINKYDYVSGYAEIEPGSINTTTYNGNTVGVLKFKSVKLNDNGSSEYNPICKAAIQFIRMHLSRYAFEQPSIDEDEGFGEDLMNALMNSGFAQNIEDYLTGPNIALWGRGKGRKLIVNKSWIRLYNPNKKKLGGGCRVKKISMSDEWSTMTEGEVATYDYGQEYEYKNEDGTSSGVASYEPQLGGDENTFKQPVFFSNDDPDKKLDNLLTPREDYYQEEPLGESFFPSPSVGYSRVTVKNIQRSGVSRTATGKVVHEFYTAKDYPTIVSKTDLKPIHNKTNPLLAAALFNVYSRDHMTASQGFVVELNDMHGKPKKQMVFQEGQADAITSVEYIYENDPNDAHRLSNKTKVIYPDGTVGEAEIGVFFDMVSDMRESKTNIVGGGVNVNAYGFLAGILPGVVFIPYPSLSVEKTQFRSATTTKVVNRFGILKETIAKDLGSIVSTRNLAYDSETGEVLLTQTTTDFNDDIYSLTYPSHWYYDGMGQAYKNIHYKQVNLTFSNNGIANIPNAQLLFSEGDEVIITKNLNSQFTSWSDDYSTSKKGWITDVTSTGIKVMEKNGAIITGSNYGVKVLRSGRRNMQAVPIASITMLKNPLDEFSSNIFENVLQSSAMEFSEDWNTFCDCFEDPQASNYTINPYVLGTKGNWRMKRSWLHLAERSQSNFDNNTNIRKDGMFTSYTPFYKLVNGKWNVDERNWTFTSEVTEFSPFGQELENRDALGRYSAATFGFNQSLATAVAANSRYRELGFDSFEDYEFGDCFDDHFKFRVNPDINELNSHTGRKSIKVNSSSPVTMTKAFTNCEEQKCKLILTNQVDANLNSLSISNGTAPYSIEYDIVNGNPILNISTDGSLVNITGANYTINFTVIDANGCKELKTLTKN